MTCTRSAPRSSMACPAVIWAASASVSARPRAVAASRSRSMSRTAGGLRRRGRESIDLKRRPPEADPGCVNAPTNRCYRVVAVEVVGRAKPPRPPRSARLGLSRFGSQMPPPLEAFGPGRRARDLGGMVGWDRSQVSRRPCPGWSVRRAPRPLQAAEGVSGRRRDPPPPQRQGGLRLGPSRGNQGRWAAMTLDPRPSSSVWDRPTSPTATPPNQSTCAQA